MSIQELLTTSVGSLPKPDYLVRARSAHSRGEISQAELDQLARKATEEWIRFQDQIGIDIVVDGEMYRGDMVAYFAENLDGFSLSGLVRSYGNRYYHKPIASSQPRRPRPITVDWWTWAQSLTQRPLKAILTGPYTMCDWSFDDYFGSRRDFVMHMAELLHQEVEDLARAGAEYIQIDEPAISTRLDELDLAIEALGTVTAGISAHTISHMCYGRFDEAYPKILDLPVDQLDLEMANSKLGLLESFESHPFTKSLGLGVVDSHSHLIEPLDSVTASIERALAVVPPERLFIDPDCGLKTRSVEEAKAKLEVVVASRDRVRRGLAQKG